MRDDGRESDNVEDRRAPAAVWWLAIGRRPGLGAIAIAFVLRCWGHP